MPEPRVQRVQLHPLPQLNGCSTGALTGAVRVQWVQVHPLPFAFSTLWMQFGCRLWVQPVHNVCYFCANYRNFTKKWDKVPGKQVPCTRPENFLTPKMVHWSKIFWGGGGGRLFTRCPQHLPASLLVLLAYIISAHQIAFTAVADTFGGKAEFKLSQHEHLMVL
jgi:hypothetical protein